MVALRMAWWTPLLFGFAGLSVGLAYPLFERLTGRRVAPPTPPVRAAAAFALFVVLYAASGFLPISNTGKLLVLIAGFLLLHASVTRTREAFALALVTATVGPTVEIVLVGSGAFRHLQPDVLGIPIWLPALYAAGSVAFGTVGHTLTTRMSDSGPRASAKAS